MASVGRRGRADGGGPTDERRLTGVNGAACGRSSVPPTATRATATRAIADGEDAAERCWLAVRLAEGLTVRAPRRKPPAGRCGPGRGPPADGCRGRRAPDRPRARSPWPISSHSAGEARWTDTVPPVAGSRKACCQPDPSSASGRHRRRWPASEGRPPRRAGAGDRQPPGGDHRRQGVDRRRSGSPSATVTRVTAGCSCQTVVVSLPLAVPRAGCVVDPGDLLGGGPGDPDVADPEIAQLRSDVGVGGAGHQPLDQVADLAGGGRSSHRRRSRGPRRRAGAGRRR